MRCLRQRGPGRKLAPVFRNPGGPCRPRPAPKTTLSPSRPPASRRPERRPSASAPGRPGGGGSWGPGGPHPGDPGGRVPGGRGPGAPGGPALTCPLRPAAAAASCRSAAAAPAELCVLGQEEGGDARGGKASSCGSCESFPRLAIPYPLLLLPPFPTPPAEVVCLPVCGRVAAGLWPWGRRTNAAARGGHEAPRDAGRVSPRPAPRPAPSAPCCAALAQPLRPRPEPILGRRTRPEGSGRRVRREPPPCRAPGAGAEGPEQSRLALKWRAKRHRGGAAGPRRR